MSNTIIKADARGVFARKRFKSAAAAALSLLIKVFFLACAAFCAYMLYFVKSNSDLAGDRLGYIPYYALFSAGVIFSVCFFLITDFNERRIFLNAAFKRDFHFFNSMNISLQIKIIYTKLLKAVLALIAAALYLFPSAAVLFSVLNALKDDGIDRYVFIFSALLYLFTVVLGLFFSFVSMQKYSLTDELFAINPHLSAADAVLLSKKKTEGSCFRLARLKLSFIPWFALCVLIFPLLFTVPYYRQAVASSAKRLLKYGEKPRPEQKPIVLLRLEPI